MFSACFGPSVVSDTDFQIHIIIHCSTDWLFQRSIVPPREKCIIEDSWVMQAKEVHMFSQNCTIISTEEIILLFIHGVLQRLCLLSLCFIASFNFRALLTKQNTKKIRKKRSSAHDAWPTGQTGAHRLSLVYACIRWLRIAICFESWLSFITNILSVSCVCVHFFIFFSLFRLSDSQKIVVRHRLWGNKREHRSLFNDIFFFCVFFLFRMLILLLVIIIVVCSTTTQKKLFFVVLFSPTNTHTRRGWPFGGRYFYISILLMSFSVLPDETNEIYIIYHHTQYIRKIIQYINIESQS